MRTNAWASIWTIARLLAAAAMIAAVVAQFVSTVSATIADGRDVATTIANFFSFFTILSNIVGAIALLAVVVWFWMRPAHETVEPRGLAVALAAATSYLAITGVVYNTLLRGLTPADDQVWWSNEILHVVAPAFFVLDLVVAPMRRALQWRAVVAILAAPILWIVYTLLRGPFVVNPNDGVAFWYPYPFLNPNGVNGWGGVTVYIIGIAVAFVVVGTIVVWIGRSRARRSAASVGS